MACGAGAAGEAIRPKDPTASAAMSEPQPAAQCHEVGATGTPLIVDWKTQDRAELEATMSEHVAVVHYDCTSLRLLPDCKVDGAGYGYLSVTSKEENIGIDNADDAQVNLPFSGAKIGAQVSRGSALSIQLVTVGKRTSPSVDLGRNELKEHCEGATHFVRGAWLGAFTMKTVTTGKVGAGAQVAGIGAAGASNAEREMLNKDGSVEACKAAQLGAKAPPAQCGAPFRIILSAISDKPAGALVDASKSKDAPVMIAEAACPAGMVNVGGKCTAPRANVTHECAPADAADCKAQCSAGNAPSCTKVGKLSDPYLTATGAGSHAVAVDAYKKACAGGHQLGCVLLAGHIMNGDGGLKEDDAAALRLDVTACDAGEPNGCEKAAFFYDQGIGVKSDAAAARNLWERACNGGVSRACIKLSVAYGSGDGVATDKAKAVTYRLRGCLGGSAGICSSLGKAYEKGNKDDAVAVDPKKAATLYRLACKYGREEDCARGR